MNCPMDKYLDLSNKEIEKFCDDGCSVACNDLLKQYLEKRDRKNKQNDVQLSLLK